MHSTLPDRLYSHVQRLEQRCVNAWHLEHHRNDELSDALAEHCRKVETTIVRLRGGNISVTVSLHARKEHESLTTHDRLALAGNKLYTLETGV